MSSILALAAALLVPQTPNWDTFRLHLQITDKAVNESSGIAPSRTSAFYYTHNDSGDKPRFFRFDHTGRALTTLTVANAKAVDWEDMASAKVGGKPYLFFGDIGDNLERRPNVVIYRVPEPGANSKGGSVRADQTYTVTYPDGPHNAEALMVHPKTGDIYIVTKTSNGPAIVFKVARPQGTGSYKAKKIGEIEMQSFVKQGKLVTGGDISPDGKYIVLRGYILAWEFDAPMAFDDWVKTGPRAVVLQLESQGEAICYSADGRSLLTTSEGSPCRVNISKLKP